MSEQTEDAIERIESLLTLRPVNDYKQFHTDVAALLGYGTDTEKSAALAKSNAALLRGPSYPVEKEVYVNPLKEAARQTRKALEYLR